MKLKKNRLPFMMMNVFVAVRYTPQEQLYYFMGLTSNAFKRKFISSLLLLLLFLVMITSNLST